MGTYLGIRQSFQLAHHKRHVRSDGNRPLTFLNNLVNKRNNHKPNNTKTYLRSRTDISESDAIRNETLIDDGEFKGDWIISFTQWVMLHLLTHLIILGTSVQRKWLVAWPEKFVRNGEEGEGRNREEREQWEGGRHQGRGGEDRSGREGDGRERWGEKKGGIKGERERGVRSLTIYSGT